MNPLLWRHPAAEEVNISAETAFVLGVVATIITLVVVWCVFKLTGPWIMAKANGIPLSLPELVGMRMRGSDAELIVATATALSRLGEPVPMIDLEAAYLSLPDTQRTLTEIMRSVRPQLVSRLEADVRSRAARGST